MTVESEVSRVVYVGAGTVGPFTVPFKFIDNGDIKAIRTTIADGSELALVLTADYSLTGAGEDEGELTLVNSLSASYKLTIYRDPDTLQELDLTPHDSFPAESVEQTLDKLTMLAQRLKDLFTTKVVRMTDGDISGASLVLPKPVADGAFKWNAAGTAIEYALLQGALSVSAFGQNLLNAANAAAAKVFLELSFFFEDAANIMAQRNGANAQMFRVYNTFTDAANYERIELGWVGNVARVGSTRAGTGVARDLDFYAGSQYLRLETAAGHFRPIGNNTQDSGVSANKWRTGYFGTAVDVPNIIFPAAQVASAGANTLDDYEEGTWTPSLGGTATYVAQFASYTKIGEMVRIDFRINVNAIGTGSPTDITGLPFTGAANFEGGFSMHYVTGSATNITGLKVAILPGTTTMRLYSIGAAGPSYGSNNIYQNATVSSGGGTYRV